MCKFGNRLDQYVFIVTQSVRNDIILFLRLIFVTVQEYLLIYTDKI